MKTQIVGYNCPTYSLLIDYGPSISARRGCKLNQSVMNYWLRISILLIILTACAGRQPSSPDGVEVRSFAETDQTVRGEFLRFFDRYGGVTQLGYPLTEEMVVEGWRVQYFEKGRLEYHPENEPTYRVTIGWLGDLLQRRRPPIATETIPRADDPNHRYFPQTGHTVSGDFLRYFDTHGGTVQFGLPISQPFLLDGRLTQDFQSARFFWHPELESPITLEPIGRVHLKASGLDVALLKGSETESIASPP